MQTVAVWSGSTPLAGEAELVEAAKRDRSRFAELYERHVDDVYAYLLARTGNEHDAADLTQHVFLQALKALPRYRTGKTPFRGWLFRIARNAAINAAKRRRPQARLDTLPPGLEPRTSGDAGRHVEEREVLRPLLAGLDDASKELLALRFGADLSCAEIGSALGKTEAATRMRLNRLLRSLKEQYQNDRI